uniref:Uncharacterized protein n=1 Tax=Triticum urartu TaxID=4572 RepID=A0A8R7Q4S3_TRIUA
MAGPAKLQPASHHLLSDPPGPGHLRRPPANPACLARRCHRLRAAAQELLRAALPPSVGSRQRKPPLPVDFHARVGLSCCTDWALAHVPVTL